MMIAGVVLAIAGAYCYLSWTKTRYAVSNTAIWYRAGILKRTQRHARLTRIQTINVSYSLVGRLLRLGYLTLRSRAAEIRASSWACCPRIALRSCVPSSSRSLRVRSTRRGSFR